MHKDYESRYPISDETCLDMTQEELYRYNIALDYHKLKYKIFMFWIPFEILMLNFTIMMIYALDILERIDELHIPYDAELLFWGIPAACTVVVCMIFGTLHMIATHKQKIISRHLNPGYYPVRE